MKNRRVVIAMLPVIGNSEINTIKVELYFSAGGMNYFNYKVEERGYWYSVTPTFEQDEGRFTSSRYSAFSGIKMLAREAKRFSQKQLNEFVVDSETVQSLIDHVVSKNSIVGEFDFASTQQKALAA